MSLKEKIFQDLKSAMKSGETEKRDVLRMIDSMIKNFEIEKKKREEGLSDQQVQEVIARAIKQRKDASEQYEKGGRADLAEKEKREIQILLAYMPEQMGEDEIRALVREIISGMGEGKSAEMGKIMGVVMGELKGKADGKLIREIVEKELAL